MFEDGTLVPTLATLAIVGLVSFLVYRDSTQIDRMIARSEKDDAVKED